MGHWEDTGADNKYGQVFCQGEDTGEIQRPGRCEAPGAGWHQGSPHITFDIPEHTHCSRKIQLHQRARHEQPLPFSTSLHFHKIAGNCCKSHIYSISASHKKAAPQQTRTRLTTVELKLHRTVESVQKYPACGMLDSQQESPRNTPSRDLCQQLGVSRSKGTRDSSFSSKVEHRSIKEHSSHMGFDVLHCFTARRETWTSFFNICGKLVFVGELENGKIHTSCLQSGYWLGLKEDQITMRSQKGRVTCMWLFITRIRVQQKWDRRICSGI